MSRVEGETKAADAFQAEHERGPLGKLFKFDSDSSHCCAGKGIHIIEGYKTVKATRCTNINEGISTSYLKGFIHSCFKIGISKRSNCQLKQVGRVGRTFGDDPQSSSRTTGGR